MKTQATPQEKGRTVQMLGNSKHESCRVSTDDEAADLTSNPVRPMLMETRCFRESCNFEDIYPPLDFCTARYDHKSLQKSSKL